MMLYDVWFDSEYTVWYCIIHGSIQSALYDVWFDSEYTV